MLLAIVAVVLATVPRVLVRVRPKRKSGTDGISVWARRLGTALLLAMPLIPVLVVMSWTVPGLASPAVSVAWWVVLGFAFVCAVAVTYLLGAKRFLDRMATRVHFGLVPGTGSFTANFWDRRCGVPRSTGVPPMSDWIADRLDELSGVPDLKFSHLTTNLVLMTTDLSEGRPYRLPFTEPSAPWLYCVDCLETVLPQRIVRTTGGPATSHRCPLHPDRTLNELPRDLPVALAVRMSVPLPGLIAAVPLVRAEPEPRVHWFSDGGITSNFPSTSSTRCSPAGPRSA